MFLYLIGLLVAMAVLVPTEFLESYIKWPLCFVVVLLVTFYFNKKKRDDAYITRDVEKISHKRGLFHPIMIFTALSYYVLAFYLIMEVLLHNSKDAVIINNFDVLFKAISSEKMIIALGLLLAALLLYVGKWLLSKNASATSLRGRAFLYSVLTLCIIAIQFVALELCHLDLFWKFIKQESNIYFYFGLVGLFILLDLVFVFVGHHKRKKLKKLANEPQSSEVSSLEAETKEDKEFNKKNQKQRKIIEAEATKEENLLELEEKETIDVEPKEDEPKEDEPKEDVPLSKKELKLQKKYKKACAKEEKRLAKEEAKLNKKIAKEEARLAKKEAKKAKKETKNEEPVAKDLNPSDSIEQKEQE